MTEIASIAEQFGFPPETLEQTLAVGQRLHDAAAEQTKCYQSLQEFAARIQAVRETWATMPDLAQNLLTYRLPETRERFYRLLTDPPPLGSDEHVREALDRLELLNFTETFDNLYELATTRAEEIRDFRDNYVGKGRALELIGLYAFTAQVKALWLAHKQERFGSRFEGTGAACTPANEPSRFLWACVEWLDRGYDEKQCKQCMRNVNEGERVGWQKQPTEAEPELTKEKIDSALSQLRHKKRK